MTSTTVTASRIISAIRAGTKLDKILATYDDGTQVMIVKSGGNKYDRLAVYFRATAYNPENIGYYFCRVGFGVKVKPTEGGYKIHRSRFDKPRVIPGNPLVGVITIESPAAQ